MDGAGKFFGKRLIHHSVPLDTALPREGGGNERHPEMRFAARAAAGMAGMEVGLVENAEALRLKRPGEFFLNPGFDRHDDAILFRHDDAP